MPDEIVDYMRKQRMAPAAYEISERYRTVHLAVGCKLFVWDYSFQSTSLQSANSGARSRIIDAPKVGSIAFDTAITVVKELGCTNLKS